LYRHLRLGEPIETAIAELHWRFGHFRGAKTGILDHFFYTYLAERKERESLIDWVARSYSKERVESSFASTGTASWLVDRILRRE
jgi:hypothetical protein